MPANKSGDSKQGLIIALVVFVILTIGLGVTTWLGYSDQEALKKKEKDAKDAETAAKKDRDWYKFQATLLKAYTGVPDSMSSATGYSPSAGSEPASGVTAVRAGVLPRAAPPRSQNEQPERPAQLAGCLPSVPPPIYFPNRAPYLSFYG